jgi:hypothetical protein
MKRSRRDRKHVGGRFRFPMPHFGTQAQTQQVAVPTYLARGGYMAPTEWDKTDMSMASADSFRQAQQYLDIHKAQHGGSAPYPATVANSVLLSGPMIASARTGPLDTAMSQVQGMQDGGRRKRNTRSRKAKNTRRRRSQKGGMTPVSAPTMLLPDGTKGTGLHGDWAQAMNPNAMAPK